MQTNEKQQEQQRELHTKLWAIANDLRGNMEANEFKNYILGLIFYRYLSEKVENRANDLLSEDEISYTDAWEDEEYREKDIQRPKIHQFYIYMKSPQKKQRLLTML